MSRTAILTSQLAIVLTTFLGGFQMPWLIAGDALVDAQRDAATNTVNEFRTMVSGPRPQQPLDGCLTNEVTFSTAENEGGSDSSRRDGRTSLHLQHPALPTGNGSLRNAGSLCNVVLFGLAHDRGIGLSRLRL